MKIYGILGEGCFGQVWKCEALNIDGNKGTTTVAVKTLKESASEKEKKDLIAELNVMKMLDPHPNVVRLLGCCTLGSEKGRDNPRERKPVLCVNALHRTRQSFRLTPLTPGNIGSLPSTFGLQANVFHACFNNQFSNLLIHDFCLNRHSTTTLIQFLIYQSLLL